MLLPATIPSIIEYIGLMIRNNIMHKTIPAHSDATLATKNGRRKITVSVMHIHLMKYLFVVSIIYYVG